MTGNYNQIESSGNPGVIPKVLAWWVPQSRCDLYQHPDFSLHLRNTTRQIDNINLKHQGFTWRSKPASWTSYWFFTDNYLACRPILCKKQDPGNWNLLTGGHGSIGPSYQWCQSQSFLPRGLKGWPVPYYGVVPSFWDLPERTYPSGCKYPVFQEDMRQFFQAPQINHSHLASWRCIGPSLFVPTGITGGDPMAQFYLLKINRSPSSSFIFWQFKSPGVRF